MLNKYNQRYYGRYWKSLPTHEMNPEYLTSLTGRTVSGARGKLNISIQYFFITFPYAGIL